MTVASMNLAGTIFLGLTKMNINKMLRDRKVSCKYGSPMGMRNEWADDDKPLYLRRVYLSQGYAPDGTYWGNPNNMYCAFNADFSTRIFIRANSRRDAIAKLTANHDGIKFLKG